MSKKKLQWNLKDAGRGYWTVTATFRGQVDSKTEEGYYFTVWDVVITKTDCQPEYKIKLQVETQYDEPVNIDDIAKEIHNSMMLFYDAAMFERAYTIGKSM